MSRAFKFAVTAVAALVASAFISPASIAQPDVERVSIKVHYGDLDMSQPLAGETLLKRIESAARRVCGKPTPRLPLANPSVDKCRREAIEDGVRRVNSRTLTFAWSKKQPATSIAAR